MGKVAARPETGKLFFDFRYQNKRCREQTALDDTPANRKKLTSILKKIEAEITLGTFDYAHYFPESPRAKQFAPDAKQQAAEFLKEQVETPLFEDFVRWTQSVGQPDGVPKL